jgi:FlgD Ig-like domain
MTGFVSLENFTTAAILKTTDGGETWVRMPIVDSSGQSINTDLEGVGFIDAQSGWVGGWSNNFEGVFNSMTVDGGRSWVAQNNTPGNPSTDPRIKINRYRFLGNPISTGYCSGEKVYKRAPPDIHVNALLAARAATPQPAGLALSYTSNLTSRSVEITYVLPQDAKTVFVGIWNHFAFHVRTLVAGVSQPAGRHTVVWDGTDDTGRRLGGGVYMCRMSVDGRTGESQSVRLPG